MCTFNNKNLSEFDCTIEKKSIAPPTAKKIIVTIPFSSETYDFSTVGTGGEQLYSNRKIEVLVNLHANSKETLYTRYSNVLNWLLTLDKSQLTFEDDENYYYLARVSSISELEETLNYGKFKVIFEAEGAKYAIAESTGEWT